MDKKAAVGDEKRPGYMCRKCCEALEKYLNTQPVHLQNPTQPSLAQT